MDDILTILKVNKFDEKLDEINKLHKSLKFTIETESDGKIAFLDMCIIHTGNKLFSTWYTTKTDTGLVLNYHAIAPKKYKKAVVVGFVHRIYRACSTWQYFHNSLDKAIEILERNQYPPSFYQPVIKDTLEKIIRPPEEKSEDPITEPTTVTTQKYKIYLQYRGLPTGDFIRGLHRINAPVIAISKMRKITTLLPSLKSPVESRIRSGVIYNFPCSVCNDSYVGYTTRNLCVRTGEHVNNAGPVKWHLKECGVRKYDRSLVEVLAVSNRGEEYLKTLESLHQYFLKPHKGQINTRYEVKSRPLNLMLLSKV